MKTNNNECVHFERISNDQLMNVNGGFAVTLAGGLISAWVGYLLEHEEEFTEGVKAGWNEFINPS
ncbi:MAG TPA: hypothetical protein VJ951_04950 [Bacteroidales bacterium]|nr:hypothetical protein [Bacteroidales bacterium]